MDEVVVYYSLVKKNTKQTLDWKLVKLLKYFKRIKSDEDDRIYFCPSITSRINRVYVLDAFENINISKDKTHQLTEVLKNGNHIFLDYQLFMFCEESLDVLISDPFFYNRKYNGFFIAPSRLNIGRRFRPIEFSFILFKNNLIIEKGEPIVYLEFVTDKKIIFKPFELTDEHLSLRDMPRMRKNQIPRYLSLDILYSMFDDKRKRLLKLFNLEG